MRSLEELVSTEELNEKFTYANFGRQSNRNVVAYALLKVACGYHNGSTSQWIIETLGLCKNFKLTEKGREYLYTAFSLGNLPEYIVKVNNEHLKS